MFGEIPAFMTIFSYGPGISQRIASVAEKPMIKYFIDFTGSSVIINAKYAMAIGNRRTQQLRQQPLK
jgi:hypothetical protein